jgi:NADPH-dependent 2,4-dienoyl-CoA reductase/sulfur reductase-like enzyme
MRILVLGGVAAGMSAASQARRRRPDAEVVVVERGPYVSYAACGMPYNLEDPARDMEDLVVLSTEAARKRGIDLRLGHEALGIDVARRQVRVRDGASGREASEDYDALVIATGASAVRPPLPGLDRDGVFVLRQLTDGQALKARLAAARPASAVIVGAGYIGMEMAEVLRARGLAVSVVEKMPQVLPGFEPEIAAVVAETLARHEVRVETGVGVGGVASVAGGGLAVETERGALTTALVLVAVGIRPNVAIAREAGIHVGETGAIAVDDHQRTSAEAVFAAGDCAEARNLVSGRPSWVPLGTTANKQGKVAGANAAGADERFGGIVGTAGFKVFELEVARTGLGLAEARALGKDAVKTVSRHASRAHSVPGGGTITTALVVERGSERLLGAQMAGPGAVAKRIDVFAAALHAGMGLEALEALDLSYAPPFAPPWDPILIAAGVARKELAGRG